MAGQFVFEGLPVVQDNSYELNLPSQVHILGVLKLLSNQSRYKPQTFRADKQGVVDDCS